MNTIIAFTPMAVMVVGYIIGIWLTRPDRQEQLQKHIEELERELGLYQHEPGWPETTCAPADPPATIHAVRSPREL